MCRCTCLSVCMHGVRRGCWVSPSYSVYSSEAVSLPEPRGLHFLWQAEGSRLGGSVLGLPWRWNSGVHTEIPVYYLCAGIRTLHLITDSYPLSTCPLFFISLYLFISCACRQAGMHMAMAWGWRSEDNFPESILPFYHVGHGNQTQVNRLGSKCLYLLNHLFILSFIFLTTTSNWNEIDSQRNFNVYFPGG